ncbi:MAG: DUF4367 domain-containing protein [Ruminococcus sp.]|nr:DUF4367 domain-containing protein [Ruminococcus sp.]
MKKLVQQINSDKNFTNEAYGYMKQEFDKERAKPFEERDFDKLERLSSEMCELLDGNVGQTADNGMERLFERIAEREHGKGKTSARKIRKFVPAVILAAALAAMNCISVLAWDMNIVSTMIEFTKGGFSVDFVKKEHEVIELPTSEDDPYGIIAECAKYDIYPETPYYLPEGFVLTETINNINENVSNFVGFIYKKDNQIIRIDYERFWNDFGNTVIPSDKYNLSETTVNGKNAVISKEDNQYTIIFVNDDTLFVMFTQDVSYDECEKIVESIK